MELQKIREDLIKAIAETKAINLDAQAKLAAEHQKLKSTEARCAALEAFLHHERTKANRCWSRAESLEEANIALKEEVELFKSERSQLQDELKRKDELIIYAVETRKACKRSQVDLMAKLASKEEQLKSTEARCAALEAKLHQEHAQSEEECSSEVELPQVEEESSSEVELPQSEGGCSSEAELPQSEGGCSSEMQQLVKVKNVKVEHETEESEHKSSNKKAKNNKQLHQKKKRRS